MSIFQEDLQGQSKYKRSLDNIKFYEPEEGYYVAFSGGKDSVVIKALCEQAGVKFDAHYAHTTVDPPELIYFMREHHKDVEVHKPELTMWELIVKKRMPPTRIVRYCCQELKEEGGNGRFVITGVRWAESSKRKNTRKRVEFDTYGSQSKKAKVDREKFNLMNDNDEKRRMIETCVVKGKHVLNPIIDWTEEDVWEFIKHFNIPYCSLYDEGFSRLGCVGCPLGGIKGQEFEFEKYPKIKQSYINAFQRMLDKRKTDGFKDENWNTGEDVMEWWMYGTAKNKVIEGQLSIFEEED